MTSMVLLSKSKHKNCSFRPLNDLEAKNTKLLSISLSELRKTANLLPLCFIKIDSKAFSLCSILSLYKIIMPLLMRMENGCYLTNQPFTDHFLFLE